MKIIGILIILNALVATAYWVMGNNPNKAWVVILCGIAIVAGFTFILQDRVIEISNKWVGTIKTAAQQATTDAKEIETIKKRIEAQSATVDLVAKSAAEAEKKLQELGSITEFSKITIAAQNDDRQAFDALESWAKNKSFPMYKEAANVFIKIRADYDGPIEPGYMNFHWPKNVDPNKLSISELREIYKSSSPIYHADLVNFIQKRTDISKKDRMMFFIDAIKKGGKPQCDIICRQILCKGSWHRMETFCHRAPFDLVGKQ